MFKGLGKKIVTGMFYSAPSNTTIGKPCPVDKFEDCLEIGDNLYSNGNITVSVDNDFEDPISLVCNSKG